jgi:Domain of unknown function (DUF1929)
VGGGLSALYTDPEHTPEIFDPATETWTDMALQGPARMYHSTALLLPDGRVLSAGQDKQNDPYSTTVDVFSPPYLFAGERPVIDAAPTATTYGSLFTVQSTAANPIARIALVHPGSVSHGNDSNQRYVDLSFTVAEDGSLEVQAPPDGNTAPPGWYMLFLVDSTGVPSVAAWIHIDSTMLGGASRQAVQISTSAFTSAAASTGGRSALPGSEAVLPSGPVPTSAKALAALKLVCRYAITGDGS